MSDRDEVKLAEAQAAAIREAMRWQTQSLQDLGVAALELRAAQRRHDLAAAAAEQARTQCDNVLRFISGMAEVPPGEWIFDSERGTLVLRKEDPNA